MKGRAMKKSIACAIATMMAGATLTAAGSSAAGPLPVSTAMMPAVTSDILDVHYVGGWAAWPYYGYRYVGDIGWAAGPYYGPPGFSYPSPYFDPPYYHDSYYQRFFFGSYSRPDLAYGGSVYPYRVIRRDLVRYCHVRHHHERRC